MLKWIIGLVVLLIVIGVVASGSGDDSTDTSGEPTTTATNTESGGSSAAFRATGAAVTALLEDKLGDETDEGKPRVRFANCGGGQCSVAYNVDTPVFDVEKEILQDQREIWKGLFTDKRFKSATLIPWGQTTSVGGKESLSPVMRVRCDRRANREIDWDNVDADGIKMLCDYRALVNFE